jgi:hypothetical protein
MTLQSICYDGNYDSFLNYLQATNIYYKKEKKEKFEISLNIRSKHDIDKVVEDLLKLGNGIYLSVFVNGLTYDDVPNEIFKLNIKELNLCKFKNIISSDISKLINLRKLYTNDVHINLYNICNLKNLVKLDFRETKIIGKIPLEFIKLQKLKKIVINCKSFSLNEIQFLYKLYYLICKSNNIFKKFLKTTKVFQNMLKYGFNKYKEENIYEFDSDYEELIDLNSITEGFPIYF